MAKAGLLFGLKVLMILICAGWISVWILKPTRLWTRKWKEAEDSARPTVFGYYGTWISSTIKYIYLVLLSAQNLHFHIVIYSVQPTEGLLLIISNDSNSHPK